MSSQQNEESNEELDTKDKSSEDIQSENKKEENISSNKQENKVHTKANKADDLENRLKALDGIHKAKDEQIKELSQRLLQQQEQINKIEEQRKVSTLLLESDLPDEVKVTLKQELDSLTVESFQNRADKYKSLYEIGREAAKKENINKLNKNPEKIEDENVFNDNLSKVQNLDDLMKFVKKSK